MLSENLGACTTQKGGQANKIHVFEMGTTKMCREQSTILLRTKFVYCKGRTIT